MTRIQMPELPEDALLHPYKDAGAYTDCYLMDISDRISFPEYIEAFYTTALMTVERKLIALFASRPSSDDLAKQLAEGNTTLFAAWNVESRTENQLLLCDFTGRTRSWLMCKSADDTELKSTRLYFGSAYLPHHTSDPGQHSFGITFHVLSGFHKLYSRALIHSAYSALSKQKPPKQVVSS